MKHTAIYLRVSTKAQDTASQEHDMTRWQANHDGPVRVYADSATGKNMNRPGWLELWSQVELGEVERIVIWRLDRLGRTASGLTKLFDELVARKVGLVSLRDSLDLETPSGRLMANVLASVAAYETEVRGERVRAGQAAAKAKGKVLGGWKKGKSRSLKPAKLRAIEKLWSAGGISKYEIARATGLAASTVRTAIKEEKWKNLPSWRADHETNRVDSDAAALSLGGS